MRAREMSVREFKSFEEFWPCYLSEHSKPTTRLLHCIGSLTAMAALIALIVIGRWWLLPLALVPGYAFAWIGHFFVEKNRPATFTYPLWSFMDDWKMLALILTGKLRNANSSRGAGGKSNGAVPLQWGWAQIFNARVEIST
jgi:hypothetical protein